MMLYSPTLFMDEGLREFCEDRVDDLAEPRSCQAGERN
jgi:hypothetical protein